MVFSIKNQQKGFSPVRAAGGRIANPSDEFEVKGAYNTDIFSGQVVTQFTDGFVRVLANDNDLVLGVFNGVFYIDTQGDTIFKPFWPKDTAVQTGSVVKASVFDAVGTYFQIDSDADTVFADTDKFADLTPSLGTGGDTTTGRSTAQLDHANLDASISANNIVRIRERSQQPGNVRLVIVSFIRPQFGGQIGG